MQNSTSALLKAKAFVVEDEDLVAMLTEDFLETLGHEIAFSAATLKTGLKIAANEHFDFCILDINLRGERSFPIADILTSRSIPYLFVSGYGREGIESRFFNVASLPKPFTLQSLERAVSTLLAK